MEPDEHIVVALSVCDGLSYFAVVADVAEWVLAEPAPTLRDCLEYAAASQSRTEKSDSSAKQMKRLPESVIWHPVT